MEIVGGGFGPNSTEVLRERGGGCEREGIGEIIEETRNTSIQNVVWNKNCGEKYCHRYKYSC
jgi:hypothetical protein